MRNPAYSVEASRCRALAFEYEDGPQGSFLLKVAQTFEALAEQSLCPPDSCAGWGSEAHAAQSLPPVNTARWTARRKAEVVAAIKGGLLSFEQACERYSVSADELLGWQRVLDRRGVPGLRVTRLQQYRDY